jgi:ornithine carbamoyltransferase
MTFRQRHFLKLLDYSGSEIGQLLELSRHLKWARKSGQEVPRLAGKALALLFEKDSTRTRCAFEVAAIHQGAQVTYLGGAGGSHFGKKETVADTARVLGRMYDAIAFRGFGQEMVEELARHAGVPVYNALTDEFHPTQILADFLTMIENSPKPLPEQTLVYLGDGANNMGNSLMVGAAKLGLDFRMACPKALRPDETLIETCQMLGAESGARLSFHDDPFEAVEGADFLYTDVWVSMGQPEDLWKERIEQLKPFRVTMELLAATGKRHSKFMHCLPAFHNSSTEVGAAIAERYGLDGVEVTDEVFESDQSIVFEQAENRLHTIKAILVATLA